MKPGTLSITSICAITFSYCAGAYAAPPEAPELCFQSKYDHEIYQQHGDSAPYKPIVSTTYGIMSIGLRDTPAMKAYRHGPAKRKEITIKTTSSQTDRVVTIDASSSTTPSGKVEFAWGNDPTKFSAGDSKAVTQVSGSNGTVSILLIVRDPVCHSTASKQVTATYN